VVFAGNAFFGKNVASKQEWKANHVEESGRGKPAVDLLGLILCGQVEVASGEGTESLKRLVPALPVEKIACGDSVAVT